ncbi:MAG: hypothetical protein COT81_01560 [Candidatus Buchananbacteria bacterium CG10_big_fil_rev_8_21_14_0_10_42_9]|uniref:Uncharacterized protein n=1 Tax=Candidatus Buchananbacteria bacterium CG10_big_fil_rev_8_21_14_0_10_42_9 TaxID=1974526 RepID=A0A2H0W1W6_9BACT|nr:MAG: hypothetical protein COT81_01560 [Candidatus Buchananbacteria bacterium CG10_big_fil_rev_8_21_14_0_10_42_9]
MAQAETPSTTPNGHAVPTFRRGYYKAPTADGWLGNQMYGHLPPNPADGSLTSSAHFGVISPMPGMSLEKLASNPSPLLRLSRATNYSRTAGKNGDAHVPQAWGFSTSALPNRAGTLRKSGPHATSFGNLPPNCTSKHLAGMN